MRIRDVVAICALVSGVVTWTTPASGQETLVSRSLAVQPQGVVQPAADASGPLGRAIALHLSGVTLKEALAAISTAARVQLTYSPQDIPLQARVSIVLGRVTVGEALHLALEGTGVAVYVTPGGLISLEAEGEAATPALLGARQNTGTIVGHVTDAALKVALAQISIRVEGTALSAVSSGDGAFTITGVAPGTYHVTARRVGYQSLTKDVTVEADQRTRLDFAMVAAPTKLDEVVTTAVGDQRRYEV